MLQIKDNIKNEKNILFYFYKVETDNKGGRWSKKAKNLSA